jgi:hypothetical protein
MPKDIEMEKGSINGGPRIFFIDSGVCPGLVIRKKELEIPRTSLKFVGIIPCP